mgnify:CR=1 FL=1
MTNSKDLTAIRSELTAIRDERTTSANSAERIGNALLALLQVADRDIDLSKYLRRDSDDTASGLIRFLQGITIGAEDAESFGISSEAVATLRKLIADTLVASSFNSPSFKAGTLGGTGFRLGSYASTADSYLEVDRLLVRKAAEFVELVIRELRHVGGEIVLTPASMKCIRVEKASSGALGTDGKPSLDLWRCYFKQEQDGVSVENQFREGDLVRCQTFNIASGSSSNARNRYYWREVYTAKGDHIDIFIDGDADEGSMEPEAGDEIVQLGSVLYKERQSAIVLSAYGDDAPSLKLYEGINSYTLEGREVFVVSRKELYALAEKFTFKVKGDDGSASSVSFAQLLLSVDGLQSTVSSNTTRIGKAESDIMQETAARELAITNATSSITQTATSMALSVAQTTTGLVNCIIGSAFRSWDAYTILNALYPASFYDGGVGGSRFLRVHASGATENTWAGVKLECQLEKSTTYTASVWARSRAVADSECFMRVCGRPAASATTDTIYVTLNMKATSIEESWTLYTATFKTPGKLASACVYLDVLKNGTMHFCRPMIEKGEEYHGWSLSPNDVTETGALESVSKKAGIDLRAGKVTVTADNFIVQNNDGDTTASVNAKGVLEVKNGLFSGFVRKQMTTLTPDNISKYITSSQSNGYLSLDFVAAGSYVNFSGAIAKRLGIGSNYISPILPFYDPSSSAKAFGTTLQEAITYIGQTVVIINQSDTTLNIVGSGTIKGGGSTQAYWVGVGYMAVLTCEIVYTSATSYKVVWNGYNIKIA